MEKTEHLFKNKSILSLKKIEDLNLKEEAAVAHLIQLIPKIASSVKKLRALLLVLEFLMAGAIGKIILFPQFVRCPNTINTTTMPCDWGNDCRVQYMNDG